MEAAEGSMNNEFPPEKRLEAPNYRLVKAGITTIPDMETLQECVAYENASPKSNADTAPTQVEGRRAA